MASNQSIMRKFLYEGRLQSSQSHCDVHVTAQIEGSNIETVTTHIEGSNIETVTTHIEGSNSGKSELAASEPAVQHHTPPAIGDIDDGDVVVVSSSTVPKEVILDSNEASPVHELARLR